MNVRKLRDRVAPLDADDFLRLAIESRSPAAAAEFARQGLEKHGKEADPETAVLLLREVFKAHLFEQRKRSAHAVARKMVARGALPEVAHADLGRACGALGWWLRAAQAYRLAARFAPAHRRALHWAACASALHHGGRDEESLAAIERAIRWSTGTRPLHRAYAALVKLERGDEVEDIDAIESELSAAGCGEGYGRYVLGMLAHVRGDGLRAKKYLREFVKRNAGDPIREATLAAELSRARQVLRVSPTPHARG